MAARLSINFAAGTIEADGSEEFVDRIYADLKDLLLSKYSGIQIARPLGGGADRADDGGEEDSEDKPRKTRRKTKSSGPSCAARILVLKDEGFFGSLRSATEVGDKLREKGTAYEGKHVAAALLDLVKRGQVRRVNQGGSWAYQNP